MKCSALGEDRIGRSHSLGDFDRLIAHVLIVGGVRGSPAVIRDYMDVLFWVSGSLSVGCCFVF
jgi:hypothetical protein